MPVDAVSPSALPATPTDATQAEYDAAVKASFSSAMASVMASQNLLNNVLFNDIVKNACDSQ